MKLTFILLFFVIAANCLSQAGFLDGSFGDSGKVYTVISGDCYAVALQPDGKILAGGHGIGGFIILRYKPDGSLDSSFGSNGIDTIENEVFQHGSVDAIAVLADKHILATGFVESNSATVKYNEDGTVDSAFNKDGVAYGKKADPVFANAIQVQKDGRIVLAGSQVEYYDGYPDWNMAMTCLMPNGHVDKDFGVNGLVVPPSGLEFTCLGLQEDEKIIAGGHNWREIAGHEDAFYIRRYTANGRPDFSFGTYGLVVTDVSTSYDVPTSISVLKNGTILVAGISHGNMVVVKYNRNGTLNKKFGDSGIARIMFDDKNAENASLLVQSDGKLIVCGYIHRGSALVRLNSNGSIDSSFGINGKQMTDFIGYGRLGGSVLQDDGKIVIAGSTYTTDNIIIFLRVT